MLNRLYRAIVLSRLGLWVYTQQWARVGDRTDYTAHRFFGRRVTLVTGHGVRFVTFGGK